MRRRREQVTRVVLVAVGVLTASPALALVWPGSMTGSYGDVLGDPVVEVLLRHRGVLQGALGAAIVLGALRPSYRAAASLTAVVTKTAFIALTATSPEARDQIATSVLVFDGATIPVLLWAGLTSPGAGQDVGPLPEADG